MDLKDTDTPDVCKYRSGPLLRSCLGQDNHMLHQRDMFSVSAVCLKFRPCNIPQGISYFDPKVDFFVHLSQTANRIASSASLKTMETQCSEMTSLPSIWRHSCVLQHVLQLLWMHGEACCFRCVATTELKCEGGGDLMCIQCSTNNGI